VQLCFIIIVITIHAYFKLADKSRLTVTLNGLPKKDSSVRGKTRGYIFTDKRS
jgi:hypothetical protein